MVCDRPWGIELLPDESENQVQLIASGETGAEGGITLKFKRTSKGK